MSKDYHLALDAMGVIYRFGDDLRDIVLPFIREQGCEIELETIRNQYHLAADTGAISSAEFWRGIGLDPALERQFLAQYWLTGEILNFLEAARQAFNGVGYISNDVAEWSVTRAEMFGVAGMLEPWIVSGEIGCRKPDPEIYQRYQSAAGVPAERIIFIDDREVNLDGAAAQGFLTLLYDPDEMSNGSSHRVVKALEELLDPTFLG